MTVPAHPFSENEIRLATLNYEAQEWLSRELHSAFMLSGLSIEDLARQLDLTADETVEWIEGDRDLSLAEVRQLANALDAHVSYRVIPIYHRIGEWMADIERDVWQSHPWQVPVVAR